MSRELSDHDWDILKKLAPELCEGGTCVSSGRKYRSILPPLSMHYSKSKEDFTQRLEKLTDEELDYLICLAENGEESLTCIRPEHKEAFIETVARRISKERAAKTTKVHQFPGDTGLDNSFILRKVAIASSALRFSGFRAIYARRAFELSSLSMCFSTARSAMCEYIRSG